MSYQTFSQKSQQLTNHYDAKNNIIKFLGGSIGCCAGFVFLVIFAFNVTGLIIGQMNSNATCFEEQNLLSLSEWLILTTSVAIGSQGVLLLVGILLMLSFTDANTTALFSSLPFIFLLVCKSLFSFIMNVIGIIELAYQFEGCKHEVQNVCIMVITIVVVNTMFTIGSCCSFSVKTKSGYTQV